MANILQNPHLGNWKHGRYFFEQDGKTGTIEYPEGWEFISEPRESDPNKLAESLHRDNGFVISAGYRAWEAGYVQKGVQLQGNQRYLAKAVYRPDVNFPVGQQVRLDAVTWQFRISAATGERLEQGWQVTGKGQYKQQEENLYVFETAAPVTIDYAFLARSVYAGNDCDFWVYELSLETVAADYGGANVPVIGRTAAAPPPQQPAEQNPIQPEQPAPLPLHPIDPAQETTGKSLGDVITAEDIDVIVPGLRMLAKDNPNVALSLNRLAEVLERLK